MILFNNLVSTFALTDTKLYVPVVTLLTQDYKKLLQQLKSKSNNARMKSIFRLPKSSTFSGSK